MAGVEPIALPVARWAGYDGLWCSFELSIGNPSQLMSVLPATTSSAITVPVPEGCLGPLTELQDCGSLRGLYFRNTSSTWVLSGIYDLQSDPHIAGLYGRDDIHIDNADNTTQTLLKNQTVIGVSQSNMWVSTMGLSNDTLTMSTLAANSLLSSMKDLQAIPSISYGYTAGLYGRNAGSLILGGYDQKLLSQDAISMKMQSPLQVDLQSLILGLNNTSRGILQKPLSGVIDTTVSELWLPDSLCDSLTDSLKLTEDVSTGYFLLNETAYQALSTTRPSLSLTFGGQVAAGTTTIVLGFEALDLAVGVPVYNYSVRYFPIRRAKDIIIFGRVLLQEAYLVVDWERSNLTVGPITIANNETAARLITIPPVTSRPPEDDASSQAPRGRVMAVALIPALLLLTIGAICLFCWRRRRRISRTMADHGIAEVVSESPSTYKSSASHDTVTSHEYKSELSGLECAERCELSATPIVELPATVKNDKLLTSCVMSTAVELP